MSQPRKRGNFTQYTPKYSDWEEFHDDPFKPKKHRGALKYLNRFRTDHLVFMSILWLVVVYYFQRVHPESVIEKCQWENWETYKNNEDPHRVLLIADPQLVDDHTYPSRPRLIQYFTKKISDNYMSINYKLLQENLEPDTTIFLGDLFDGGREWHDDGKWFDEWKRFNRIFPSYPNRKYYFNILGNHDAGWDKTINKTILNRFKSMFGDSNDYQIIGNHTFLFLDTISFSARNNNDSSISEETMQYFRNLTDDILPSLDKSQVAKHQKVLPRVLLTHVPFFRDPRQEPCRGPREHKSPFPLINGGTFQTVLFPEDSSHLLRSFQPEIIFSGDDHDYCEINHRYSAAHSRPGTSAQKDTLEITVKSFSMNMGVAYPASQLLSLRYPLEDTSLVSDKSYQTSICYSYSPFSTLYSYSSLVLATIMYWVLLCLYPQTFVRLELHIQAMYKYFLLTFVNYVPIFKKIIPRFLIYDPLVSNSIVYDGNFDDSIDLPISPDRVTFPMVSSSINRLLKEKKFKQKDSIEFAINCCSQIFIIYLIFVYFYTVI